ncbi:alcohol dehydrogenase [Pyrenophora seminiperda CCB06]|uniref:Alcohol dehydrogenase n=1 Tax=Pyrenophora seminiperda CCB06 TaxID=1302712 RepID=A0A3M7LZH9_9PLEO|nr:alcohol dehydrogenase [Pyrenophora seminiperda CCB06]
MQHILQAGLSAGMSAVSGLHTGKHTKPNPIDPSFDGLAAAMPQDWIPSASQKVIYKGKTSDVHAPPLCIGAWSWGDTATWNWKPEEEPHVVSAWKHCVSAGVNFIDTAQVYGTGRSEAICGKLFQDMPRDSFIIQTKYFVVPQAKDILHPIDAPLKKLQTSLKNFNLDYVDIYLVHGPIHLQTISMIAKGMADCVNAGLTKTVGVANYSLADMLKMSDELAKHGVPLAINQVEYSVLRREPEISGLLQACKERGIVLQSYSSLAQGRLTGKYTVEHAPPKEYRFSSYDMKDVEPVNAVLKRIGERRGGLPISAVALNYNLCKGITPVVGVRKEEQAVANCKALGWRLSDEEIREIDGVGFRGHTTVLWQQG